MREYLIILEDNTR